MESITPAKEKIQFPCSNCGALQIYSPGSGQLRCDYCGHSTPIRPSLEDIREYPFREALQELETTAPVDDVVSAQCETCAAQFAFEENVYAGECPFCGTPIVTKTGERRPISPRSLIPFRIAQDQAKSHFRNWIKNLWFAPGDLKKYVREDTRLAGVYIPYWTYDSDTTTAYRGERGDTYQVPRQVVSVENGRRVVRTRMETRVRWIPAQGTVFQSFDDILVGASRSLPRTILDSLQPWNLSELVPYNEAYLSGFRSEVYQIRLDQGFDIAAEIMNGLIRNQVARDIGGDFQRIHHLETRHNRVSYKHLLLPVWSAGFRFRSKTYRFVINGQSGKVKGERPYSGWKIAAAVVAGGAMLGVFLWLLWESGALEQATRGYY
ncbi:MAG: primosomal protein N' (replication factor Y) - superfamily II helicase [Gammaproteobacteria bacterium]|nr:primosomal protein N' (replication factor Y) - superfamily II helicase [Gammaproteobacteria bacterium]